MQERLDANPQAMRVRRATAEHPFGTLKMRMGASHFLMKRFDQMIDSLGRGIAEAFRINSRPG